MPGRRHGSPQSTLRAGVQFSLRTAAHLLGRSSASGLEGTELQFSFFFFFSQNYLVDNCSTVNLNPLATRIHKYLNNGLFRVLPVYQACRFSAFFFPPFFPFFLLLKRKGSKLDLADGLKAWIFYLCFQNSSALCRRCFTRPCWCQYAAVQGPSLHAAAPGQQSSPPELCIWEKPGDETDL